MKPLSTALLVLTLSLGFATSTAAQPTQSTGDWSMLTGDFTFDGEWLPFKLDRKTRKLTTYGFSLTPPLRDIDRTYEITPDQLERLESALAQSKPDHRHSLLLREGARGDQVESLQEALTRSGFPVEIDGAFGPQTRSALTRYQEVHGLHVRPVLHKDAADHLGLRGPLGKVELDGSSDRAVYSGRLSRVIVTTLMSAKLQREPVRRPLAGRIVKVPGGLELVTQPNAQGKRERYSLRGLNPKLEQAAGMLGEVTLDAQVWESADTEPGVALFRGIKTRVTQAAAPSGVEVGSWVKVVGLTRPRTTRNGHGEVRLLEGSAVQVAAEDGTRGLLHEPRPSGARAKKAGINSVLQGGGPR